MNYDFGTQQQQQHSRSTHADPYEILNVQRDADATTIRNRFRTLTRLHHPDRNRSNPHYDPRQYATICSAYETLKDPQKRAAFDQSVASSWHSMKAAAPPQVHRNNDFQSRSTFGEGDVRKFNDAFDQQRKGDPNDRGYGDMMAERMTEQEAKSGNRRSVDAPRNVFGSTSVSSSTFNDRFKTEAQARRRTTGAALQERNEGEPQAWYGGHSGSDISMFDGVIVNQERQDFSSDTSGLQFADYMAGFETFSEQLPEDHPYYNGPGDLKHAYNERLSELSQVPERGHNLSFAQAETVLQQQRQTSIASEQARNRDVVMKYRDQYSSIDLLPSGTPTRGAESQHSINQKMADRFFQHP